MLPALVAGIVTLAIIIAVIVFVLRRINGRRKKTVSATRSVTSINTFGVEPEKQKTGFGTEGHTQVAQRTAPSSGAGAAIESRFVAMGVIAAAIFGSLTAKLFSLQVLSAGYYENASASNVFTTIYTPAPRGLICDYSGIPLVENRSMYTVLADADVADNFDVVSTLSTLMGIPRQVIRQRILDTKNGARASRVVENDASLRNIAFISEHPSAFPGITCEMRTQRSYPYGALGAHVLGYVSTASEDDMNNATAGQNIQAGDMVGKSGVEAFYEELLAGDHGTKTVLADASGNVKEITSSTDALRGNDLYLTLRAPVQAVADSVMRDIVAPGGVLGQGSGSGAALVCLDATNGEIVAMSNFPTFTPESFIGGIPQEVWDQFNTADSHYPLMNRVIQGTYPAASTFKAFTAMAALTDGIANAESTYDCTGTWTGFGKSFAQKCWLLSGHGTMDIISGIANSCDTVFYEIAKSFYESTSLPDTAMQDYISEYSFGSKTGVDLYSEAVGRIPTPKWKAEYYKDVPEEAKWQGGDMTNMSIGQGYVLVTPLQIACGYCGIARGEIYRPHLLREVRNSLGEVVLTYKPEVIARPNMSNENIALVREGLRQVLTVNDYDSQFFSDVDYTVAGKTGTAEVAGKTDYSWFACYAPADNPKYVVSCLFEEGGANTRNAIPLCAEVIKAAMAYDDGSLDKNAVQAISGAYTVDFTKKDDSSSSSTARQD